MRMFADEVREAVDIWEKAKADSKVEKWFLYYPIGSWRNLEMHSQTRMNAIKADYSRYLRGEIEIPRDSLRQLSEYFGVSVSSLSLWKRKYGNEMYLLSKGI